jgi:hypothetical protein
MPVFGISGHSASFAWAYECIRALLAGAHIHRPDALTPFGLARAANRFVRN